MNYNICHASPDLGASCGSQLAVRSSPNNFGNSRSQFTVLATTRCRHGFVCINFTCDRSEDVVNRFVATLVEHNGENTEAKWKSSKDDGSKETDDLRTNEINVENSHDFHYSRSNYDNSQHSPEYTDDVFTIRETVTRRSTSIPWPIPLTTEMVLFIGYT